LQQTGAAQQVGSQHFGWQQLATRLHIPLNNPPRQQGTAQVGAQQLLGAAQVGAHAASQHDLFASQQLVVQPQPLAPSIRSSNSKPKL
jgi:hypothetical protein